MLPYLLLSVLALALLAFWLAAPWRQAWRRHRLQRQPFPAAWRQILREQVPQVARLPADLQLQLKRRIQVFLAEKPFIGCQGLVVSEAMRVVVAAQACLLLLNRRQAHFDGLRQVLLYPGAFAVDRVRTDAAGVQQSARQALSGESWTQGQVILSWADVQAGAAQPDDGRNVVIHEFAHQLDQASGSANGMPPMPGRARRARWTRVMSAAFAQLQAEVAAGQQGLIDAYGATDPAEFFAVVSEVFFEQPLALAQAHPALYQVLSDYYRVKPLSW